MLFYEKYKWKPATTLRSDSEPIFLSKEAAEFLETKFIELQTSAPDRHFQNSVERDMQTVIKGVTAVLHGQPFLRLDLWPAALLDFIEKKNRTPNRRCYPLSPYQKVTKKSTKLNNQFNFKFGEVVIVGKPKLNRDGKFDVRNEIGIYIGQDLSMVDTHRIYYPHNHTINNRGSVHSICLSNDQLQAWFAKRIENKAPVYQQVEEACHDLFSESKESEEVTSSNSNGGNTNSGNIPIGEQLRSEVSKIFNSGENQLLSLTDEEKELLNDPAFVQLLDKFTQLLIRKKSSDSSPINNNYSSSSNIDTSPTIQTFNNQRKRKSKFDDPPEVSHHNMSLRNRSKVMSALLEDHVRNAYIYSEDEVPEIKFEIYCNAAKSRKSSANDPYNDSPSVKKALESEDREEWLD